MLIRILQHFSTSLEITFEDVVMVTQSLFHVIMTNCKVFFYEILKNNKIEMIIEIQLYIR